ncbi:unnamed protein product, partial [Iphiclides podalirius]
MVAAEVSSVALAGSAAKASVSDAGTSVQTAAGSFAGSSVEDSSSGGDKSTGMMSTPKTKQTYGSTTESPTTKPATASTASSCKKS